MERFGASDGGLVARAVFPRCPVGAATKPKTAAKLDTKAAAWIMPRLPDGRPDLHGYWTDLSFTPMKRPAKYQGREFLTEKEMQEVYEAGLQVTYEGESVEGHRGLRRII